MTIPAPPNLAAMMKAAEIEWRAYASEDWTTIDFRRWPRGFRRSAWVVAGYIGSGHAGIGYRLRLRRRFRDHWPSLRPISG
jgi:hypothetical protein